MNVNGYTMFHLSTLTLFHSERPKLYAILVFLSAIGLRCMGMSQPMYEGWMLDIIRIQLNHK